MSGSPPIASRKARPEQILAPETSALRGPLCIRHGFYCGEFRADSETSECGPHFRFASIASLGRRSIAIRLEATASAPDFIVLIMAHTLDRSYDGIVIGAGHHGLILGSYLAKAGLDILLVDRRLRYGGGLSTEEVTAPGFFHNLHSINHFHITEAPWFKDLALAERVSYLTPRYELGQPHLDGSALVYGRDLEETLANVARFSRNDAATFREWNRPRRRSRDASSCRSAIRSRCRSWNAKRC